MTWNKNMDDAPRDGTLFLAFSDDGITHCYWHDSVYEKGWAVYAHRGDGWFLSPTHWMPLPQPPEVEQ